MTGIRAASAIATDTTGTTISLGVLTVAGVIGIAVWLVSVIAFVKVITRVGYNWRWVAIMVVPIVNVVVFLVFAYKDWPTERELRELRGWANQIQRGQQGYGQQRSPYGQDPGYPQK